MPAVYMSICVFWLEAQEVFRLLLLLHIAVESDVYTRSELDLQLASQLTGRWLKDSKVSLALEEKKKKERKEKKNENDAFFNSSITVYPSSTTKYNALREIPLVESLKYSAYIDGIYFNCSATCIELSAAFFLNVFESKLLAPHSGQTTPRCSRQINVSW